MTMIRKTLLIVAALTMLAVPHAWAVRPFITDDGNILEYRQVELTTWTQFDKFSGQLWQTCTMALSRHFELGAGVVLGYDKTENDRTAFSYTLPLIQGKYLLHKYEPNKLPGIAIVAGSALPFGKGAFVPPDYGAFAFMAATQCIGEEENVLIHTNAGTTYLYADQENNFDFIWGIGTQIKIYKGLHGVAEVVSGDPYIEGTGLAYQVGGRYFISDLMQIDAACGNGFSGENKMPFWVTFGVRFVITAFEK